MPRAKKQETLADGLKKAMEERLLDEAAKRCVEEKLANGGRLKRGFMINLLDELGCPSLNRDKINYRINKTEKERENGTVGINEVVVPVPVAPLALADDSSENVRQLTSPSALSLSTQGSEKKRGRPKKIDTVSVHALATIYPILF